MSRFLLESASAASGEVVGTVFGLQSMSPEKKNEAFLILGGLCALIALAAGAQLVRIQVRVPEYGWTTQKVFHLLNLLCFGIYATTLAMWKRNALVCAGNGLRERPDAPGSDALISRIRTISEDALEDEMVRATAKRVMDRIDSGSA